MAHLGQSTEITTVQSEEVVLTGADGQTFKMKVADLAEAIRKVMPIATASRNGLMSTNDREYIRYFSFHDIIGKNVNIGVVNGLIRFKIWSQTNKMSLYFISSRHGTAQFVAGQNISEIGYSFSINSSYELVLEDISKIDGRITHVLGLSENIV